MAISLVGSTKASGSSTTPTVTAPTLADGDRLYIVLAFNVETTTCVDNNGSTPCTEQGEYRPGSLTAKFAVYYRDVGASEPASYTFTLSASVRWSAVALVLRGMHISNTFEVSPAAGNYELSTTPTCPGATTVADNAWAFAVAQIDGTLNGAFTAGPSGWTEIQTETGEQPLAVYYKAITPAGATGNKDFTTTVGGENANGTLSIWSVAPAGSAPPPSIWAGIYWTEFHQEDIPELVARGVTRFQVYGNNAGQITAIGNAGGKAWVELAPAFSGTNGYNASTLQTIVNATHANATVEGYLSNDEADLKGYNVTKLQTAYTDIKAITSKPVGLCLRYPYRDGAGGTNSGYSHQDPNGRQYVVATGPETFDIMMPDPYNIPYGLASSIGSETASTVAVVGGRPVYTIIQSFSWGTTYGDKLRPDCYPTVAEMTEMGTSARSNGADNLWIYTWSGDVETDDEPMSNFNTPCWDALATITAAWGVGEESEPPPPDPTVAVGSGALVVIQRRRRRRR